MLYHLQAALPDKRSTVLFVGYQAAGTRGRTLIDGAREVKIRGQFVPVNARIERLDSMSAHADSEEILRWLGGFKKPPSMTYLVHGEPGPMDALKATIASRLQWNVHAPGPPRASGVKLNGLMLRRVGHDDGRSHVDIVLGFYADTGRVRPEGRSSTSRPAAQGSANISSNGSTKPQLCSCTRTGSRRCRVNERILTWHLYQAAIAGRDIFYDQRYAHNLDMRDVLEAIITHPAGDPGRSPRFSATRSCSGPTPGPYNNLTARKVRPEAARQSSLRRRRTASAAKGAKFPLRNGETLDQLLTRLKPMFFDASVDPSVTTKTPIGGQRHCCRPAPTTCMWA